MRIVVSVDHLAWAGGRKQQWCSRSIWYRKAQRSRLKALVDQTASWGIEAAGPVGAAPVNPAPVQRVPGQALQPNSDAAKARAAAVRDDLMRRRADTQQSLRKYVQSGKISSEMAQQRMAEVDQVRRRPCHLIEFHFA